jgi:TPR repeat protein
MRRQFSAVLLCLSLVSYARGGGSSGAPSEPYLKEVQHLEMDKLVELHKAGRLDATVQLARSLWWDGDAETPIELLRTPAERGIPVAQYLLGIYLRFKERDLDGSAYWLKTAAAAGHAIAQETLASYYEKGSFGFPVDDAQAYRLYRQAAEQDLKHSQLNVAMMLCTGKGVTPDRNEAAKWLGKANKGQGSRISLKEAGCN